ncbi:MAG: hypothetical protein NWR43_01045 [Alphaproteobacteria bacterium]|nr:hypothetical protein [Alphaproteobacteria bacterium]
MNMKLTLEIPDRVYKILKDFSDENGQSVDSTVYKAIEELVVDLNLTKEILLEKVDQEDDVPFEKILEEAGMKENLLEKELNFET